MWPTCGAQFEGQSVPLQSSWILHLFWHVKPRNNIMEDGRDKNQDFQKCSKFCFCSWNLKEILSSGSTHLFTSIIGTTFNSIPILEGEKWYLPVLCLHAFSQWPLQARTRIIHRSKGIFKANTAQKKSWESVWGKQRYSMYKLGVLS